MTAKLPNKYEYLWIIQGNYGNGWEDLTAETNWKECRVNLKLYRENDPAPIRVIRRRELNPAYAQKA